MNTAKTNDRFSEEEILKRAAALAKGEDEPGFILNIPRDEVYSMAALSLLCALYGSKSEAITIIEGARAFYPSDGTMGTIHARICRLFEMRQELLDILESTENWPEMSCEDRLERMEMALEQGFHEQLLREKSRLGIIPAHLTERHKNLINRIACPENRKMNCKYS